MDSNHRGSWAEHIAIAWLLRRGYIVAKNVCSHGPFDLIAVQGGVVTLIDVKSQTTKGRRFHRTDEQKRLDVRLLTVFRSGSKVECQIEEHVEPQIIAPSMNAPMPQDAAKQRAEIRRLKWRIAELKAKNGGYNRPKAPWY